MDTTDAIGQLKVTAVRKTIKDRTILQDVSFRVDSGEMFAILGPTGSGKSTLLNIITGRLKSDSGSITVDGRPIDKSIRRRFGYVLQNDVFFTNLTLWQTLYFTAQIQMPESMSTTNKIKKLNHVVEAMGLTKCLHTVIGDMFVRGLSGGEKKRASIACELLTDPALLFLDEPTSGLDSSTAWSIIQHLKAEAVSRHRLVVSTIHQPSSQIFFNFDRILLIADGKSAYYGRPEDVQSHFSNLGLHCRLNYNPADFLLELTKGDGVTIDKITGAANTDTDLHQDNSQESNGAANAKQLALKNESSLEIQNGATEVYRKLHSESDCYTNTAYDSHENGTAVELEMEISRVKIDNALVSQTQERWPTSFWHQFKMLTWRGFLQSKGKVINKYTIAEIAVVTLCIALGFFRKGVGYEQRNDVMGLLFISFAYWNFQMTVQTILSFPEQRPIIAKERASGAYRLSALYISKTVSDLPVVLCLSTVVFTLNFWIGALGNVIVYLKTAGVFVLWIFLSHAQGYFIGATIRNARLALTVFQAYSISSFVYGGFFIQYLPSWLRWMKFLSVYTYSFSASTSIVFSAYVPTSCNISNSTEILPQHQCANSTIVTSDVILKDAGIDIPVLYCIVPMIGIDISLRLIAYFAMRLKKDNIY